MKSILHRAMFAVACLVFLLAFALAPAYARDNKSNTGWQNDFQSRLEVYAIMQMLNVELLGSPSATRTLEKWCQTHRLAAAPSIVAQPVSGDNKPPSQEQLQRLEVTGPEQVKHRKVRLFCGDQLLSEADNWYVPGRADRRHEPASGNHPNPFRQSGRALGTLPANGFRQNTLVAAARRVGNRKPCPR